jgi:DNA polymerase I
MTDNFLKLLEDFIENNNTSNRETIVIIDGLNMFIRNYEANPSVDASGNHVGGIVGFFNSLRKVIYNYSPKRIVIVFDGKGGSLRRKKLHENYKQKRSPSNSFNRFADLSGALDESKSRDFQIKYLLSCLECLPIDILSIDNIEADDVIAYMVTEYFAQDERLKIIVSSDKDFLQLINENVSVYSHSKSLLINERTMIEQYGYLPQNYLTYRCFAGDRTDAIPGVKYVGEVGLNKHFELNSTEKIISLEEIINKAKDLLDLHPKQKLFENIVKQKDVAYKNYKLMQLTESSISGMNKSKISAILNKENDSFYYDEFFKRLAGIGYLTNSYDKEFWSHYFK